jgi:hypothetical protein
MSSTSEKKVFRASFSRLFITMLPGVLVGGFVLALGIPFSRWPTTFLYTGIGYVVLLALVILVYPVEVHPWGIKTCTGLGTFMSLRWEEMGVARRSLPWPMLPYVLVAKEQHATADFTFRGWFGSAQTIPMFLTRQDEFKAAVLETAPPGNPLAAFLWHGCEVPPNTPDKASFGNASGDREPSFELPEQST